MPRCARQMRAPWFLPSRLPRLESADFSSETQTTASADKHRIYCSAEVQSLPTTVPGEQTAFLLFLRDTEDAEECLQAWVAALRNPHTQDPLEIPMGLIRQGPGLGIFKSPR